MPADRARRPLRCAAVAGWLLCAVLSPSLASVQQSAPAADAAALAKLDKLLDDGFALFAAGKYPETRASAEEALRLSTALNDQRRIARSTILLGAADYGQGDITSALARLQRGKAMADEVRDARLQVTARQMLGNTLRLAGRFADALVEFQEWLRINREQPKPDPEARISRALAVLSVEMGDPVAGERYARQAIAQAKAAGDTATLAGSTFTLASTLKNQQKLAEAVEPLNEALALARTVKNQAMEAEILNSQGSNYFVLGRIDESVAAFRAAMAIAETIAYTGLQAQVTERLGVIEASRGNHEVALDMFGRASAVYRALGDQPEKRWSVEYSRATSARALKRHEDALAHYKETIAVIERLERGTVPTEVARALPISARREVFAEAADLLLEMGRPGEALELADRSRGRAFLHLLGESKVDVRGALTSAQRDREAQIAKQIVAARGKPEALAEAIAAQDAFHADVRRSHPAYAGAAYPELATVDRIRRELAAGRTALVEYMLTKERCVGWVVTSAGVHGVALGAGEEVRKAIEEMRAALLKPVSALTAARDAAQHRAAARRLYDLIVAPLAAHLQGASRLLVVPDGAMTYLPFEALVTPRGEFLVQRYAIAYSQSASAALALQAARSARTAAPVKLLAFGDPEYGAGSRWSPLPRSRQEVNGLGRFYPPARRDVRTRGAATESAVKSAPLAGYRHLHFAVHGLMDEDNPSQSGLALSQPDPREDGMLRMGEIAQLRLDADLVTLSACETSVGKKLDGEGLLSLSRAFFYAGARNVVASLWAVDDESTAELMRAFYRELAAGGDPADALRRAQLAMLRGPRAVWRHPHFWAPFVLQS